MKCTTKGSSKFSKKAELEQKLKSVGLSIEQVKNLIAEETNKNASKEREFLFKSVYAQELSPAELDEVYREEQEAYTDNVMFAVSENTDETEIWFNGAKIPDVLKASLKYDPEHDKPTLVLEIYGPALGVMRD